MKLKHYNPETCQTPVKTKDLYMVLRKNGAICFTGATIKALNLKIGIKLELLQDQDKGDWYLVRNEKGFELRNLGQQIGFSSTLLVNFMWPNRKKEDKSFHTIINETPIHYEGSDMYLISFPKK